MWSPSAVIEKRLLKPVVFLLCLLPSIVLLVKLLTSNLGFNPVEILTHETGQWGLRFLLVSLAVTPLRKITNMVWLTRFRRMFGLFAFYYGFLHFGVYFVLDQSLSFKYLWDDVLDRPYITVGFAALCMLLPLAITSTNKLRRKLGRRWNLLHKLAYVATGLVVLHFIWLVKADYREPIIYLSVFLVLMLLRLNVFSFGRR